jgi:hypothetical protein
MRHCLRRTFDMNTIYRLFHTTLPPNAIGHNTSCYLGSQQPTVKTPTTFLLQRNNRIQISLFAVGMIVRFQSFGMSPHFFTHAAQFVMQNLFQNHFHDWECKGGQKGKHGLQGDRGSILPGIASQPQCQQECQGCHSHCQVRRMIGL